MPSEASSFTDCIHDQKRMEIIQAEACDIPRVRRSDNLRAAFESDQHAVIYAPGSLPAKSHHIARQDSLVTPGRYPRRPLPPQPAEGPQNSENVADPSSGDAKAPSGSKEDQGEHVFPEVCAVASPVDQGENVTPPKQDPEHHQCNRNSCNYQITPSMGAFQHPYTAPIPAQPTLTPTNPQPLSELLEDTHFIGVENARECTSRWIDSSDYPEWVQNPDQIDHSPPEHTVRRVISQGFEVLRRRGSEVAMSATVGLGLRSGVVRIQKKDWKCLDPECGFECRL